MCSITALLDRSPDLHDARQHVLQASRLQVHRGPDWSGIREYENAIIAHERLAIVDVMSEHNPLKIQTMGESWPSMARSTTTRPSETPQTAAITPGSPAAIVK